MRTRASFVCASARSMSVSSALCNIRASPLTRATTPGSSPSTVTAPTFVVRAERTFATTSATSSPRSTTAGSKPRRDALSQSPSASTRCVRRSPAAEIRSTKSMSSSPAGRLGRSISSTRDASPTTDCSCPRSSCRSPSRSCAKSWPMRVHPARSARSRVRIASAASMCKRSVPGRSGRRTIACTPSGSRSSGSSSSNSRPTKS